MNFPRFSPCFTLLNQESYCFLMCAVLRPHSGSTTFFHFPRNLKHVKREKQKRLIASCQEVISCLQQGAQTVKQYFT